MARRTFLQLTGAAAGATLLAGCGERAESAAESGTEPMVTVLMPGQSDETACVRISEPVLERVCCPLFMVSISMIFFTLSRPLPSSIDCIAIVTMFRKDVKKHIVSRIKRRYDAADSESRRYSQPPTGSVNRMAESKTTRAPVPMRLCWVQAVFAWLQPLVDKFQAAIGGCQLENLL